MALEMWVDAQGHHPVVYLAGTLTDGTGADVAAVVRGLVVDGHCQVVVDVGSLTLEIGWFAILCGIQDEARRAGGSVAWSFASNPAAGFTLSGLRFWDLPGETAPGS